MSLHCKENSGIPEETRRVAKASFPKGNLYMKLRDELGELYTDSQFAALFASRGRRAESPGILAMVSVFQFLEGLSDRQAADAVRSRLDWKYALGLELTDPGFYFSVLGDFRLRLLEHGLEEQLLHELLTQFTRVGILKSGGRQRTDSTHVLAAIRTMNRLELVGETLRSTLNTFSRAFPDWVQEHLPKAWHTRYRTRFERYRLPKSNTEQEQLYQEIGKDGYVLLDAVYAKDSPEMLRGHDAIETLRLVWLQQYYRQVGQIQLREGSNMPSGDHLIQSPYDREARFSKKRQTTWVGYKTHLSETCETDVHVMTNVETTPATSPDSAVTRLIHESLSEKTLLPEQHLVDTGDVDAALILTCRKDYGVELVGPVLSDNSWQAKENNGFDLSSFTIDWKSRTATCPQGHRSHIWSESTDTYDNAILHVRFASHLCKDCSCRARCPKAKTGGRSLKLRPQEQQEVLQEARQRQDSHEFKALYNIRAGVEGSISPAVRVCDVRHTRYIGQAKTHLQHILTAIGLNIVRFVDWVNERPHAKTRTSAFAALAGG